MPSRALYVDVPGIKSLSKRSSGQLPDCVGKIVPPIEDPIQVPPEWMGSGFDEDIPPTKTIQVDGATLTAKRVITELKVMNCA